MVCCGQLPIYGFLPSGVLKKPQSARYGVKNALKILVYSHVRCAFSVVLALPRTRLRLFQQAAQSVARQQRTLTRGNPKATCYRFAKVLPFSMILLHDTR